MIFRLVLREGKVTGSTPVSGTRNFVFPSMPVSLTEKNSFSLKSPGLEPTIFIYIRTQGVKQHLDWTITFPVDQNNFKMII